MENKIYVGNLSFGTTEELLKDTFAKFGTVNSCKIIMDHDSGRSKGFGFIEMAEKDSAVNAIDELDGVELEGRSLKVNESKPRSSDFTKKRW